MVPGLPAIRLAVLMTLASLAGFPAMAEDTERTACNEDAMLVFDASGSMAGTDRLGVSTPIPITRIDKVRSALAKVLPTATRFRRVGLITYGPGPYQQCNVQLNFAPMANAAGSAGIGIRCESTGASTSGVGHPPIAKRSNVPPPPSLPPCMPSTRRPPNGVDNCAVSVPIARAHPRSAVPPREATASSATSAR